MGIMTGNVWLRSEPDLDAERLGLILSRGRPVEILEVDDDWYLVEWTPITGTQVIGWSPAQWVGTITDIPENFAVTPTTQSQ